MRQGQKQTIKLNRTYYLSPTIIEWIDLFSRKELRDIVISSLKYCIQNKGLNVYCYCIMTNHLHMIVNCNEPFQLSETIRDFKRHIATECFKWISHNQESRREWMIPIFENAGINDPKNKSVKVWQSGNQAIELYNPEFTWTKVLYVHNNPVKAGWVNKPENWIYSSASNYMEEESILPEVIRINTPVNFKY